MASLNATISNSQSPATSQSPFFFAFIPFLLSAAVIFSKWLSSRPNSKPLKLPPSPPGWPVVGNLFQFVLSGKPFMHYVRDHLRPAYGPIFTLQMGTQTLVVVSSPDLAHEAFIQKGQLFANRPPEIRSRAIFSSDKFTVNSAVYGPVWRSLRRNMVSNMLSSARLRGFAELRESAMERLVQRLRKEAELSALKSSGPAWVLSSARFAFFCILISMCFGFDLPEEEIVEMDRIMKKVLICLIPRIDDFVPFLRPFFAGSWKETLRVREEQERVVGRLIERRRAFLRGGGSPSPDDGCHPFAYLDTLFDLEIEGRPTAPSDDELVSLCSEFLNAATDTTAAAIEWAIARLIENPVRQERLHQEIVGVVGAGGRRVKEKDTEQMPYLKAFIVEVLRKHPPTHLALTHSTTGPATLGGYDIPPEARLEFYLPSMSEDPRHWTNPERFDPERFLGEGENAADITGVRGVKMMPFGVGRRICPGLGMGMLHISLMVATLVQEFEWGTLPSQPKMDFDEKLEFAVVMKKPLRALIRSRRN